MISSTMQDSPLTITEILAHGTRVYPRSECVTWEGTSARRATFAEVALRAERLAAALAGLGIGPGDRVATLCWNHQEHLEAYFAVPCAGAVLHTLNLRLPPGQLAFIANQANDRVILVDSDLLPLLAAVAGQLPGLEAVIVVGEGGNPDQLAAFGDRVRVLRYEELLAAYEPGYAWPELDERSASSMCYTSGTTGDPKGVVYSHRSTFLHAMAGLASCVLGTTEADRMLPVVPMFHVNAWGIPYGAFLCGASLLMPGKYLHPEQLARFIATERATMVSGVPTIWSALLQYGEQQAIDLSSVRLGTCGGAAMPRALLERFQQRYGLRIIQGWGMTETSPLGGVAIPPADVAPGTPEDLDWRTKSGRIVPGVQMRIVDPAGEVLPHDGVAEGEIEVRGPWITGSYYGNPAPEKFHDGWLRTGDLGRIDDQGFFEITDRVKDVIKSGGEWISSVELENQLMAHPAVAEAAVIGVPDPRWDERPLACVVLRAGAEAKPDELAAFVAKRVARWQTPENWTFIEALPKTTVGKFDKKALRAQHAAGALPVERVERGKQAESSPAQSSPAQSPAEAGQAG